MYITSRRFTPRTEETVSVRIYSNCELASIKVNGVVFAAQTSTDHIFNWDNIPLQKGENKIEATGISGDSEYKDNVVWIMSKE